MKRFTVPCDPLPLHGDCLENGAAQPPSVLCLHGGGRSNRTSFEPLRQHLLSSRGIGSCAFDLVGRGRTGGALEGQSLALRTQQACRVIEARRLSLPLRLIAVSMGAYTALRLTALYPVDSLVLIVPAVYAADAYTLPFGASFRAAIRRPESWRGSDAWQLLAGFTGHLLVIEGQFDAVIPGTVIDGLVAAASKAVSCRRYTAQGTSHRALSELRRHRPQDYTQVLELIAETCERGPSAAALVDSGTNNLRARGAAASTGGLAGR